MSISVIRNKVSFQGNDKLTALSVIKINCNNYLIYSVKNSIGIELVTEWNFRPDYSILPKVWKYNILSGDIVYKKDWMVAATIMI